MSMNAKKCDRCDAYYSVPVIDGKHSIVEVCTHNGISQVSYYDLCPLCTADMMTWVRAITVTPPKVDG